MKFQIKSRWMPKVLFECEADSLKLAVEEAVRFRADLTRANLTDANLTDANLIGADLTRAKLIGADLTRADLTG